MSFQTEHETEYWLKPMWSPIPLPCGGTELVENTRQFWAEYWHLRDRCGYTDSELAAYAERLSRAKGLPYIMGFMIGVYCLPHDKNRGLL